MDPGIHPVLPDESRDSSGWERRSPDGMSADAVRLDARAGPPARLRAERGWPCAPDWVTLLTRRTYEPAEGIQAPAGRQSPAADIGLTKRRDVGVPGDARADLAADCELAEIIPDHSALGSQRGKSQRVRAVQRCLMIRAVESSRRARAVRSSLRARAVRSSLRARAVRSSLRTHAGRRPGCCILAVICVRSGWLTVLAPVPDIGAT
jgi:hypothetical protein